MKLKQCLIVFVSITVLLLLLAMKSNPNQDINTLGPEVKGLRMGLDIQASSKNGKDSYTVRIRIVNTGSSPITLVGKAPYDSKSESYAQWLKEEMCFLTFPELLPPSAQTEGFERMSPNPQTTLSAGEKFTVSWKAEGRYLKSEHYYNTTPYFPSEGLYSVRAKVIVHTDKAEDILLYSNEQVVPVGGSIALGKHGLAYVTHIDEEKQQVVLSLGSHHRIAKGDVFRVPGSSFSGWMLTVVEVRSFSSLATVEKSGPHKDTLEPLPPKSSKAQLWEFGQRKAILEISAEIEQIKSMPEVRAEHAKHLVYIGKTRRELEKAYHRDGGISSPFFGAERYVLNDQPTDGPRGHVLKVKILFRPANVSDEIYQDAKKLKEWMLKQKVYGSENDIVVDISAPYWEPPYFD
jgi:hypothetical protein